MIFVLLLSAFLSQQVVDVQTETLRQSSDSLITTNWTIEDGLPVNSVNYVLQDNTGYLWFTTYDGIVRFDGRRFNSYTHSSNPELPQNRAVHLYKQKNGVMWISLENGGIVKVEDEQFKHFGESNGFTGSNVFSIEEDQNGRVWFGTADGLFRYYNGEFKQIYNRQSSLKNRIEHLFVDDGGAIWASTRDGLIKVDGHHIKNYEVSPDVHKNAFKHVHRDRRGRLLVGTSSGLYLMQDDSLFIPGEFNKFKEDDIYSIIEDQNGLYVSSGSGFYLLEYIPKKIPTAEKLSNSFHEVFRDSNNILWLINLEGELVWLNDGELQVVKNKIAVPDFHFNRMTEDREGNIWLTTARNGIVRIKRSKVTVIGEQEGLLGSNILGLFEDSRGNFWVSSRDEGLNKIQEDQVTQYEESGGISTNIVQSIAEDSEGNILAGHYQGGLDIISGNSIRNYKIDQGTFTNDVKAIFVSRDSTIWLGTYGGLVRFDPQNENHTVYTRNDGLAGNRVRYIDEDENGGLWIGTQDGGVSNLKNGHFTNYTHEQGLSSNNIRSVYVDKTDSGTVWVGTETNGLNRIRYGEIHSTGVEDGLPDHIIHFISEDRFGWLWISSNRGIFKILKEDLNNFLNGDLEYYSVIHFGSEEGMRNPEANGGFQEGGLYTSDDTYWFSTQEGVAIFDVDPEVSNTVPPTVKIEHITAGGKEVTAKEISLEPQIRSFEINFFALTFVSPQKTRYRYKLEGYDEGWTELTGRNSASYTDVPPDTYTFRVMAANDDGIWSPVDTQASITVNPFFYQQAWFYFVLAGGLISILYGASKIRYRYLLKKQKKLENLIAKKTEEIRTEKAEVEKQNRIIEKQAERLEESNQTKDKFFSIIAHDLRNPFQGLMGLSDILLESIDELGKEERNEMIRQIKNSSQALYSLSENLLQWATLQTGKVKPYPELCSLNELIEKNIYVSRPTAEQKNISLTTELEEETKVEADKNMIDLVIRNLLSNAIKFTDADGKVSVSLHNNTKNAYVKVKDNGIGIPEEKLDELMKAGSNKSRTGTRNEKGSGLGLVICKDMVEMHNGSIDVESEEGAGTTFTVVLPKKREDTKNPATQRALQHRKLTKKKLPV